MNVSYGITVCNESKELDKLLTSLTPFVRPEDEVVVLVDDGNTSPDVQDVLVKFPGVIVKHGTFQRDFAQWKNLLNSYCSKDYIFQIDADEIVPETLLKYLPAILDANPDTDLYLLPRVNTVPDITPEDVTMWNWKVNDRGWINWPDWQLRIYRNNPSIKWMGKVHEKPVGHKTWTTLPESREYALQHEKTIARQRKQNELYASM